MRIPAVSLQPPVATVRLTSEGPGWSIDASNKKTFVRYVQVDIGREGR